MPYQVVGREVTRGTICRDRWRVDVTLMCSDRIAVGRADSLFVEIRWREQRDEGSVAGQPDDAKPIVLSFRKATASAAGDIRFDAQAGPASKSFGADTRELVTIFGASASVGSAPDVFLDVRIEGDVRASIPLQAGVPPALAVRTDGGAAPAPDYLLEAQRAMLRAVPAPVAGTPPGGVYRWVSVKAEALELIGNTQAETIEVAARQVSSALDDRPLCVLFTPPGGPAVMVVHRMTVARSRIVLEPNGQTPAPHLVGRGRKAQYRAELTPAGLSSGVSWAIGEGGTRARIVGAADQATVEVEGLEASAAVDDVDFAVTYHSTRNPAAQSVGHRLTVTSITLRRTDGSAAPRFLALGRPVGLEAVVLPGLLARNTFWIAAPDAGATARVRVDVIRGVALQRVAEVTGTAASSPHVHDDVAVMVGLVEEGTAPVASTMVEHRVTVTMDRPLRLPIAPPDLTGWTLVYGFGPGAGGGPMRTHAMVETFAPGLLLAAVDGALSAQPPRIGGLGADEDFVPPGAGAPLPDTVTLYLHLSPLIAADATFAARARELNEITGFAYINLETASLATHLAELLDTIALPAGAGALSRAERAQLLVRGDATVPINAGHAIGAASSRGAAAGHVRAGFAALAARGPLDPAHTLDWMRDFVADGQPAVDQFLALVPKRWPVIDPGLTTPEAIEQTRQRLYSLSVLDELRRTRQLTAAQWRQVGDNQKALWRSRLLRRSGHAPAANTAPPFEFDDQDWQNVFQLEAVVEFYLNYNDPWRPAPLVAGENSPREPFAADGTTRTPGYVVVDLLAGWHLVVVDSFGARLEGDRAEAAANVVTLTDAQDQLLRKVNANFDTIYLPSDRARASRTYRITALDRAQRTVTLDGAPDFDGGASRWHIPAGVSGVLPALDYDLGPGGARGFDHFEGALFLVKDGVVHGRHRWSSYTSRANTQAQLLSSLRGNKRYDFSTFRSANAFRNYSIKIVDHGEAYDGVAEARFYFATPVTADSVPAGGNPATDPHARGKTEIRIHYSETNRPNGGCSSAGCVVARGYYPLRDQMIDLYQADYRAANGADDPHIARIRGRGHAASQALWEGNAGPTLTAAQWNDRIRGTFWVIRPDERPLG